MMALAPRRVGDFGDDVLQGLALRIKAIIKTHWVKDKAKITHVREQTDWPLRTVAGAVKHQVTDGAGQILCLPMVVIAVKKTGYIATLPRAKPMGFKQLRQFSQIQIHHE